MHGLTTGLVQNAANTLNELTQGVVNGIRAIHGQNPGVHSEAAADKVGLAHSFKDLGFGAIVLGCRLCACDRWCPVSHVSLSCICGGPFPQWSSQTRLMCSAQHKVWQDHICCNEGLTLLCWNHIQEQRSHCRQRPRPWRRHSGLQAHVSPLHSRAFSLSLCL
jgi:hypothetical protein